MANHAARRHGAYSTPHLSPAIVSTKKAILARMQLRQRDLTWAQRELLDTYCRAKAKVVAIDQWLEGGNPLIDEKGRPPEVLRLYFTALNSSTRALEALRLLVAADEKLRRHETLQDWIDGQLAGGRSEDGD
jgi:hypothetical protein